LLRETNCARPGDLAAFDAAAVSLFDDISKVNADPELDMALGRQASAMPCFAPSRNARRRLRRETR
jgi:hypothetical protein